jgi:hypothetical protein
MLFFIAELAPTLAFKLCAWCLGKMRDGIVYLVKPPTNPASNEQLILDNDCVIIKRFEYEQLKQLHNTHNTHNSHQLSESESESLVDVSSSSTPSK